MLNVNLKMYTNGQRGKLKGKIGVVLFVRHSAIESACQSLIAIRKTLDRTAFAGQFGNGRDHVPR